MKLWLEWYRFGDITSRICVFFTITLLFSLQLSSLFYQLTNYQAMLRSITSRSNTFNFSPFMLNLLSNVLQFHTYPVKRPPRSTFYRNPTSFSNQGSPQSPPRSGLSNNLARNRLSVSPNEFLDSKNSDVLRTLASYRDDWKMAMEFFTWVENQCGFKHSTETYNQIIDTLGKFFEFDAAWNLIEKMRTSSSCCVPDHATFRIMFKRYVSAHMVKEAIDTFDRMEEFRLRDEVSFSNLIDALCEYKHVIEAQDLCFGSTKNSVKNFGFSLNTKIYNMILRGWFKMGWWKKCREFWEEMDKRGVQKDLYSYSIYMDILCKSGKPWKTLKLYKEMKRKRIKLDVVAYNTVVRAIGISEGVDVSFKLFREMKELGCHPNVVTYNTILKLLCENGRYKEASRVLNDMYKAGCVQNVLTYHTLFGSLQKPEEILRLFDRMIEDGVHPRMDTFVMLMRKFGRWGFLRPVFIVWKKMKEHGLSPDKCAYDALIDALVQKNLFDMARKYDNEMLEKGLSSKPRTELGTKVITTVKEDI